MRLPPVLLALTLFAVLVAPGTTASASGVDPAAPALAPADDTASDVDAAHHSVGAASLTDAELAALRADAEPTTTAINASERSRVLVVPEAAVQMTTVEMATLDIGPAAEFAGNVSSVRMENAAVAAYVDASSDDVRRTHLSESLRDLERQTDALRERRQDAILAYNQGTMTTQEFVVELATIAAKADALEDRVTTLRAESDDVEGWSESETSHVRSRLESARYQLRALGGPVSDRAAAAVRGAAPPIRVFVTTGPEGYELSTVSNGTYVREAYRGAVRENNESAPVEEAESELIEVFRQSYPVLTERWDDPSGEGSGTTFVLSSGGEGGNVTAFVDSSSERVFKEYQYLDLDRFPAVSTASNVQNGVNLTVTRSYPGGPVKVNVTDVETGEPVDATITLSQNGERGYAVGRTGDDGVLWTLSPRGRYSVLAFSSATAAATVETNSTEAPALD